MRRQAPQPPFDREKFRQLILLLAELSADDAAFGAIKLNKLLFFCDILAYREWGRPITGAEYMRLQWGPVPRVLVPIRREMIEQGLVEIERVPYFGRKLDRVRPRETANRSIFTDDEIRLVEQVVLHFRAVNSAEISELSHRYVGWEVMTNGDTIPYQLALVGSRPPTDEEVAYAEELRELAAGELDARE